MVNHEENISRMLAEGLISERQADLLRSAVQGAATEPTAATPRPAQHLLPILITVALVILIVILFSSGSQPEAIQDISQTLNQPGSTGNMNRNLSATLGIALILIIPLVVIAWLYNSIVSKEEKTMESWAQVEAVYQRRADLIPALVETVSRYVKHEQKTMERVTEARAESPPNPEAEVDQLLKAQKQATELLHAQLGKTPTDEAMLTKLTKAQVIVGKSVHQLIAVAEAYPQLRASDQFLELQAQFEGTENRILTARSRFNEAVEEYNGGIRKLPGSLIAGIGHFQRKAYFRADAGSAKTPERKWI
jgi:LemA protein